MSEFSIVYVITNPAMPGLVKIGRTSQGETGVRIAQLYSTGVPVPFELKFACRVENSEEVESALHTAFGPQRINPKREFFRIEADQVIAILKLLHTEDATSEVSQQPTGIDEASIAAAEQLRSRRPNMNFTEMGIPIGSELSFVGKDAKALISGLKKVRFGNEQMSLTAATREVLGIDYSVQPAPHWTFNGRSLREFYDDTYESTD